MRIDHALPIVYPIRADNVGQFLEHGRSAHRNRTIERKRHKDRSRVRYSPEWQNHDIRSIEIKLQSVIRHEAKMQYYAAIIARKLAKPGLGGRVICVARNDEAGIGRVERPERRDKVFDALVRRDISNKKKNKTVLLDTELPSRDRSRSAVFICSLVMRVRRHCVRKRCKTRKSFTDLRQMALAQKHQSVDGRRDGSEINAPQTAERPCIYIGISRFAVRFDVMHGPDNACATQFEQPDDDHRIDKIKRFARHRRMTSPQGPFEPMQMHNIGAGGQRQKQSLRRYIEIAHNVVGRHCPV
ncbi:MAG TPA: hypothetical protein VHT51_07110 [Micropepsaceae bacterium]|nr:hypothetical protein [Micropepsaceae bacterium]